MPTYAGCNAKIIVKDSGPGDPAILVSELNSWSIDYSFTPREFRGLGAYYPVRGISAADWSLSLSGYFDHTDPGQNEIRAGTEKYFEVYPIGDGDPPNDPIMRGTCYIDSVDSSASPDDLISVNFSATGNSELEAINTFIGNT